MTPTKNSNTFLETKRDFRNAWLLLRENFKAFLSTQIFALLAFILGIIFLVIIIIFILILNPSFSFEIIEDHHEKGPNIFVIFVGLLLLWVFYGFLSCQHGLANDIVSSGEMYAEFRGSFKYYKKYWWQYPILTLLTQGPNLVWPVSYRNAFLEETILPIYLYVLLMIILLVFTFIMFIFFIHTFPSLTYQGNLKNSFIESTRIFRVNKKRVIITWGLFFLIFVIPGMIISFTLMYYYDVYNWILPIWIIYMLFVAIFQFPMMTLLASGLYRNIEFERFKPL